MEDNPSVSGCLKMINNSNLVALESLDKAVLIQMIQRYRQKEELQKQKLYGLTSVSNAGAAHPASIPNVCTGTPNTHRDLLVALDYKLRQKHREQR